MNAKVLFVVAVVAALLAVSFVDAKKVAKQEKKGKAKGGKVVEKAKVEKREVKAPKVEKVVVEKIVEKVVEVEKPAKQEKSLKHVEVIEEEVVEEEPEAPTHVAAPATPERPHVVKPKHLKFQPVFIILRWQTSEDRSVYHDRLRGVQAPVQEAARPGRCAAIRAAPTRRTRPRRVADRRAGSRERRCARCPGGSWGRRSRLSRRLADALENSTKNSCTPSCFARSYAYSSSLLYEK
ncbi:hypothetical protein L596_018084 [Steinernema carpocapsae]|uniref:Uncharacterized protein n=1 Tax=Steinernema carpocapsae TaxID=34508 RepID=A0A4V6A221_STECR|nr:hypothetical protein L596_018084 [Steinernema carpocapsae]